MGHKKLKALILDMMDEEHVFTESNFVKDLGRGFSDIEAALSELVEERKVRLFRPWYRKPGSGSRSYYIKEGASGGTPGVE